MPSQTLTQKTKEVDIIVRTHSDENGFTLSVSANGDFRHHVVEELLFLLADKLEMKDHLDIVINKLKVRLKE